MKQSLSLKSLTTSLSNLFKRHHIILFALTVVVGVSVAMFLLYNLINATSEEVITPMPSTIFDEETIARINKLAPSDGTQRELILPSGRINPFVE